MYNVGVASFRRVACLISLCLNSVEQVSTKCFHDTYNLATNDILYCSMTNWEVRVQLFNLRFKGTLHCPIHI